jgi:hypothetical protein
MLKMIEKMSRYIRCRICGRDCGSVGSGEPVNGMCERCYENGGDDE